MGLIKKILKKDLQGLSTTDETEVYPVTSTEAVYSPDGEELNDTLEDIKRKLASEDLSEIEAEATAYSSDKAEVTVSVEEGNKLLFTFGLPKGNPGSAGTVDYNYIDNYIDSLRVSAYVGIIYKSSISTPDRPTGGSYSFSDKTLTPPDGWSTSYESLSGIIWMSIKAFYSDDTEAEWSIPVRMSGEASVVKTRVPIIYCESSSLPSTPSGGSYNWSTNTCTPPSGWILDKDSLSGYKDYETDYSSIAEILYNKGGWSSGITLASIYQKIYNKSLEIYNNHLLNNSLDLCDDGDFWDSEERPSTVSAIVLTSTEKTQIAALIDVEVTKHDTTWMSIGTVYNTEDTITWSSPCLADYSIDLIASKISLTSALLDIIALKVILTTELLEMIASSVSLDTEELKVVASNVTLDTTLLKVIASNVIFTAGDLLTIALNITLTADLIETIASEITFTTDLLNAIANKVTLDTEQLEIIGKNVVLSTSQLDVVAGKITLTTDQLKIVAELVDVSGSIKANGVYLGTASNGSYPIELRSNGSGLVASGGLSWDNSGNITLTGTIVSKGTTLAIKQVSNNYTALTTDDVIIVKFPEGGGSFTDPSGGTTDYPVVTLPSSGFSNGKVLYIRGRDATDEAGSYGCRFRLYGNIYRAAYLGSLYTSHPMDATIVIYYDSKWFCLSEIDE